MSYRQNCPKSPLETGIGLRHAHIAEVLARRSFGTWFEVHAENYMHAGTSLKALKQVRRDYPVSFHAVGLSLGSADGVRDDHLERFAQLVELFEPILISDHLSWSAIGGVYLNDLLPVPYSTESLDVFTENIDRVQDRLKRQILVENPSAYLAFRDSLMSEAEFLTELAHRTDCGILLDVNNLFVTAENLGLDVRGYLNSLPRHAIGQYHLAGHSRKHTATGDILIDDHGSAIAEPVWDLFTQVVRRFGPRPTIIEWDCNIPEFEELLTEARHADDYLWRASGEVWACMTS